MSDLTKAERIRLIERALRECGQDVTHEAVAAQFYRETKEMLPGNNNPKEELNGR